MWHQGESPERAGSERQGSGFGRNSAANGVGDRRKQIMYDSTRRPPSEAMNGSSFNSPPLLTHGGASDWPPKSLPAQRRDEELSLPQSKPDRPRVPNQFQNPLTIDTHYANGNQHGGGAPGGMGGIGLDQQGHTSRTQASTMSHATNVSVQGWGGRTRVVLGQNGRPEESAGGRWQDGNVPGAFMGKAPAVLNVAAVRMRGGLLHADGGISTRRHAQEGGELPHAHQNAPHIHAGDATGDFLGQSPGGHHNVSSVRMRGGLLHADGGITTRKNAPEDSAGANSKFWNSPADRTGNMQSSPNKYPDVPIYLADAHTSDRAELAPAGRARAQRHSAVPNPGPAFTAEVMAAVPSGLSNEARHLMYCIQRTFLPRMRDLLPPTGSRVSRKAFEISVRITGLHQRVNWFASSLDEIWATLGQDERGEVEWERVRQGLGAGLQSDAQPGGHQHADGGQAAAPFDLSTPREMIGNPDYVSSSKVKQARKDHQEMLREQDDRYKQESGVSQHRQNQERRKNQEQLIEGISNRLHVPGVKEKANWHASQERRLEENVSAYRHHGSNKAISSRIKSTAEPERAGEWYGPDFYARRQAEDPLHYPRHEMTRQDPQLDHQRRYNTPSLQDEKLDVEIRSPGGVFGGFQRSGSDGVHNEHGLSFSRGMRHFNDNAGPPWDRGVVDARSSVGVPYNGSPATKAARNILGAY